MTEVACSAVVSSMPPQNGLASTGIDLVGISFGTVALLVIGALLLGVHVLKTRRAPRIRLLAPLMLVAVAGSLLGASGSSPASAAPDSAGCALISLSDVDRGAADDLLPGRPPASVLGYTITNDSASAIDVTVTTAVTSDPKGAASAISAALDVAPDRVVRAPLDLLPATAAYSVPPGGSVRVEYRIGLLPDTGNDVQAATVLFDSTVTAVQH